MARDLKSKTEARFARLFQPLLSALRELGGSGRPAEIKDRVMASKGWDRSYLNATHKKSGESVFGNDVDWARFYLVRSGYIDASKRGVWTLTEKGRTQDIDAGAATDIVREVDAAYYASVKARRADEPEAEPPLVSDYREETLQLLKSLPPTGFENLAQRLLRESGFEEVHVMGRSNDGGIDGDGILKINAFVSFRVLFQCKRWANSVGPDVVRDFRGAMVGRADKGIIITTAYFTPQAEREASRDGAQPIELVDGEALVDILAKLELGLSSRTTYELVPAFFDQFR